jgi:pyruvate kinase
MAYHRPRVPIIAITPYEHIYRRLSLFWGVIPTLGEMSDHQAKFEAQTMRCVLDAGLAQPNDYVVMTGGHPIAQHGQTNFLKILQIDDSRL